MSYLKEFKNSKIFTDDKQDISTQLHFISSNNVDIFLEGIVFPNKYIFNILSIEIEIFCSAFVINLFLKKIDKNNFNVKNELLEKLIFMLQFRDFLKKDEPTPNVIKNKYLHYNKLIQEHKSDIKTLKEQVCVYLVNVTNLKIEKKILNMNFIPFMMKVLEDFHFIENHYIINQDKYS